MYFGTEFCPRAFLNNGRITCYLSAYFTMLITLLFLDAAFFFLTLISTLIIISFSSLLFVCIFQAIFILSFFTIIALLILNVFVLITFFCDHRIIFVFDIV